MLEQCLCIGFDGGGEKIEMGFKQFLLERNPSCSHSLFAFEDNLCCQQLHPTTDHGKIPNIVIFINFVEGIKVGNARNWSTQQQPKRMEKGRRGFLVGKPLTTNTTKKSLPLIYLAITTN